MSSSYILSDNGVSSGSAGLKSSAGNDGVLVLQTANSSGTATTALAIDTSQNVGIGTSSPVSKLDALNATVGKSAFSARGISGNLYIDYNGAGNNYYEANYHLFTNNNGSTEWMRIDSSGNVGIGTTSPSTYGLSVAKTTGNNSGFRALSGGEAADFVFSDAAGLFISNSSATLPTMFWINGSERMRIDSSGIVTGTAGNLMLISGTSASASGTAVDFTSIPSWVKRITVMFSGVSTNGTSLIQLQIGSGSITNTGYAGVGAYAYTTGGSYATASTTGFAVVGVTSAPLAWNGSIVLTLFGSNKWTSQGCVSCTASGTYSAASSGVSPALGGALDRVRITTVNGTDTFDAGSISILYE